MKPLILCDIDGTLIDSRHEQSLLMAGQLTPTQLRARTAANPRPVHTVVEWINEVAGLGAEVAYLTGRPEDENNHKLINALGTPPGRMLHTPQGEIPQRWKRDTARTATKHGRPVYALDDDPVMSFLYPEIPGLTYIHIPGWYVEEHHLPITPTLPHPHTVMENHQ